MRLVDLFSMLPLGVQHTLAKTYLFRELKNKVTIRVKGLEILEETEGPCIFVANHLSNLDGVVLTRLLKKKFDPYFVAGIKLSGDNFTRFFKNLIKTIDIKPNTADLESIKNIINTLKGGESIMMFPEGTRSRTGQMIEAKKGITLIARMAKVPIVPIALMGTEKVVPIDEQMDRERIIPGHVDVVVGKPFYLAKKRPDEDKHDFEDRAINDLMNHIAVNLRPEYRGIYDGKLDEVVPNLDPK
ncbi:MAG: lysophospholipid acyltransferase family protein [Clostridiaceae bacterium]